MSKKESNSFALLPFALLALVSKVPDVLCWYEVESTNSAINGLGHEIYSLSTAKVRSAHIDMIHDRELMTN